MLRQQLKQDSHYLVKYLCDDNIQIRTRSFFKTDSIIHVSEHYEVKWGTRETDVDTAVVLASGDYDTMRAKYNEETYNFDNECSDSSDSLPPVSPTRRSPSPPPLPPTNLAQQSFLYNFFHLIHDIILYYRLRRLSIKNKDTRFAELRKYHMYLMYIFYVLFILHPYELS